MKIIAHKVLTGFCMLSSLATFSCAGGRLESVKSKKLQNDLLTAI